MKKTSLRLFQLFFSITFFQISSFAGVGLAQHRSSTETQGPDPVSCDIKLESLDFAGMKFGGDHVCIKAKSGSEAVSFCRALAGGYSRVVNPTNRQYGQADGDLMDSLHGYYYCVKGDPQYTFNNKELMCKAASEKSNYKDKNKLNFRFVKKVGTDGDCLCSWKDKSQGTEQFNCNQEETMPPYKNKCEEIGLETHSIDEFDRICKCSDGRRFVASEAKEKCAQPAVETEKKPDRTAAATTEQKLSDEMKNCVDQYIEESKKCKDKIEALKLVCDPKSKDTQESKEGKATQSAIDNAKKLFIGSNVGAGAQQECFAAGVIANSAKDLLSEKKEKCESGMKECEAGCGTSKYDEFTKKCGDEALIKSGNNIPDDESPSPNQKYYTDHSEEIRTNFESSEKVCKSESQSLLDQISAGLTSAGNALRDSAVCMCKLANGSSAANCDIPTVTSCEQNSTQAGCAVFGGISACTPGASFNAQLCACQTNPKTAGCPGGGLSGNLSNFGGAIGRPIAGSTQDGVNFSNLGGGSRLPELSLNSGTQQGDTNFATNQVALPDSAKFASVSGGGIGGSNNGASSRESNSENGNSSYQGNSLFGQAKTFFKNMMGNKLGTNGDAKFSGKKGKSDPDMNKFRPRGIASGNGIGGKNKDIFKMVNECFNSETCRGKNWFLEPALKHK